MQRSLSLLNSVDPSPADLLTRYISLVIHQNIGAAQGQTFMDTLKKAAQTNDYLLVIEGAIPLKMPQACMIAGRPFETTVLELIPNAKAILAVGTCASLGGIPAADGNDTGSVGVKEFMEHHNLRCQHWSIVQVVRHTPYPLSEHWRIWQQGNTPRYIKNCWPLECIINTAHTTIAPGITTLNEKSSPSISVSLKAACSNSAV